MDFIIGIDEVGRGPIAGPIVFCAFIMSKDTSFIDEKDKEYFNKNEKYRDSKKTSEKQRQEKYNLFTLYKKENKCDFLTVSKSAKDIDSLGLSIIINKCLEGLVNKIIKNINTQKGIICKENKILNIKLDGGLKFKKDFIEKIENKHNIKLNIETIIKGDEKVEAIRNASIIAKVKRDKYMHNLNKKIIKTLGYDYHLDSHMGYGTALHYEKIHTYGLTEYHRKGWVK